MDLISYPISLHNEDSGWYECCNVSSRSLVNTEGPCSSSFREQCPQSPPFFKMGYLAQIEDLLPESACIQCLVDVVTMPDPSPQLCRAFQVISDSELPSGSTDALSKLPSSPASPFAQSCFRTLLLQASCSGTIWNRFPAFYSLSPICLLGTHPMTVGAESGLRSKIYGEILDLGHLPLSWQ